MSPQVTSNEPAAVRSPARLRWWFVVGFAAVFVGMLAFVTPQHLAISLLGGLVAVGAVAIRRRLRR